MALTNEEKDELANSNEMKDFYQTLSTIQSCAVSHIQRLVANGVSVEGIKGQATKMTTQLRGQLFMLTDGNNDSCGPGRHWDEALGACVPD